MSLIPVFERRELIRVTLVLCMGCVLAFSPDAYLPMLARSFMLWWMVFFVGVVLWAAWRRQWWVGSASTVAAFLVLAQVMSPVVLAHSPVGPVSLRIAHMNVLQPNGHREEAIAGVVALNADVISVQEVSQEWADALVRDLAPIYHYHRVVPGTNCYGIALFSKFPFKEVSTVVLGGTPFIEATVLVNDAPVRVFAMHASSPGSYADFRRRNAQLAAVGERVRRSAEPTIIVGDLNTVHWDKAYERLCARGRVHPINSPFTITWPSIGPMAMIPLDHVLLSDGLSAGALSSFNVSGSDHRGLFAEVHIDHAR